jgi:16S rRNA (guanine527-N7)-methyltransferase
MLNLERNHLTQKLKAGLVALDLSCTELQVQKMMDYLYLLIKWNKTYNLTAIRDPEQMIVHHFLDSLSMAFAVGQAHTILDVGTGGGFPGMVLAILYPDKEVTLVDTIQKKTAFLTQVKLELGLKNVIIHTSKVEALDPAIQYEVIVSRAFSELVNFVTWSCHLLKKGGVFLAMKGVYSEEELLKLPMGSKIKEIYPLIVPDLNAERHLVLIESQRNY